MHSQKVHPAQPNSKENGSWDENLPKKKAGV
jgi:hypothetical protein